MPVYRDAVHGVSMSEAFAEAATVAPVGRTLLETFELRHPSFTDEEGNPDSIWVVNDHADLVARIEDDAPVRGGEQVRFVAVPVRAQLPEESDSGQTPTLMIEIDGVSQHVVPQLDAALRSLDPITVTLRIYAADDPSGPALYPSLTLTLREVEVSETTIRAQASFGDPANRGFPAKDYLAREYPGLVAR